MRVAILTSEAVPFAKTGGLADVSGALPKALSEHDVDARLILPLYDQIDRRLLNDQIIENVSVEWRGRVHSVRFLCSEAGGAPTYLVQAPEFFARPNIYGYQDDHIRFAFFSRAALALTKHLDGSRTWSMATTGRVVLRLLSYARDGVTMRSSKTRRRCFHCTTSGIRDCLMPAIFGGSGLVIRPSETTSCSSALRRR